MRVRVRKQPACSKCVRARGRVGVRGRVTVRDRVRVTVRVRVRVRNQSTCSKLSPVSWLGWLLLAGR